ncbi:MAG TPA: hypothetical protein VF533_06010 [Solirubrobacteraceae bacterium]
MISAGPDPVDVGISGGPIDTWVQFELPTALDALTGPRHRIGDRLTGVDAAHAAALDSPGLYALYAEARTWRQLGLGAPPDDRPLYVGKAEDSPSTRDLRTHFATGATGQSSPRRSFAALLVDDLNLVAQPRRPERPEPDKWTHYALEADGDQRLTDWMLEHLHLAVWSTRAARPLAAMERAVMQHWQPPLNLTGVRQPWSAHVRKARAAMAQAAVSWIAAKRPDGGR